MPKNKQSKVEKLAVDFLKGKFETDLEGFLRALAEAIESASDEELKEFGMTENECPQLIRRLSALSQLSY
jgi:hypothetical protein